MTDDDALDLGLCCVCRNPDRLAYNIIMLPKRTRVPGTGWGCVVCHLPFDGASAVVCDLCLDRTEDIVEAIDGYPAEKRRIAITELSSEPFDHDLTIYHG